MINQLGAVDFVNFAFQINLDDAFRFPYDDSFERQVNNANEASTGNNPSI